MRGIGFDLAGKERAVAATFGILFALAALAACSPGAFRTAKELACEGAVSFGAEDVSRRLYLTPLMPYTFLFWQGGRFTAFAPEQTKCMLADVDFEEIERVRVRNEEVVTCAEACTTFYGVVSLDDAYLRYREACSDPVTRRRFVELIEVEASFFELSLIHISEPTRQAEISYAVFCLKKKNKHTRRTPNSYADMKKLLNWEAV